jgi:glutamate racemase
LVAQIEKGELQGPKTRAILESALNPMLARGIDRVVMGCTHYPFVIPLIQEIVGPEVKVIDPAPAVARQVGRVLAELKLDNKTSEPGQVRCLTSGDPAQFSAFVGILLGLETAAMLVHWQDDVIVTS